MKKLGLALGGGGSRALSHLGLLSVLEEERIPVSAISGSSFGALVGAMYAFEKDATKIRQSAIRYFGGSDLFGGAAVQPSDGSVEGGASLRYKAKTGLFFLRFFSSLLFRPSFWRRNPMTDAVSRLLPEKAIEETLIPFACNAMDVANGTVEVFTRGDVRKSVLAGTCVATIFPPFFWGEKIYIDAAPVASVPARAVRALGAEVVLAVDLRAKLEPVDRLRNGFDVFRRLEATSSRLLNEAEIDSADLVIRPPLQEIFWGDFAVSNIERAIRVGEDAARGILPALRAALRDV